MHDDYSTFHYHTYLRFCFSSGDLLPLPPYPITTATIPNLFHLLFICSKQHFHTVCLPRLDIIIPYPVGWMPFCHHHLLYLPFVSVLPPDFLPFYGYVDDTTVAFSPILYYCVTCTITILFAPLHTLPHHATCFPLPVFASLPWPGCPPCSLLPVHYLLFTCRQYHPVGCEACSHFITPCTCHLCLCVCGWKSINCAPLGEQSPPLCHTTTTTTCHHLIP